jgi:integrase
MTTIRYLLPKQSRGNVHHHPAVPVAEMPALMEELRALDSTSARALEWTILCAARTGETLGAEWGEIDLDQRIWVVPAERSKTGKPHRVPLSDAAVELLDALPGYQYGLIFTGPKGRLSSMAMLMCIRGLRPGTTVHGMRSAFRNWAAENAVQREVAEACLAHVVAGVEGAYLRSDLLEQRRPVMESWAAFVAGEHPATAEG